MDNKVTYTVNANDMLSGKLQQMNGRAQALQGTMGGLSKIVGTLGIGFAVFKGMEFIHGALEKVEELHQATAQVQAVLTSTNEKAGLSMKELEESAKSLSSNSKFGRADIFGMQSLLLTFTQVKDKIFNEAQPAIMDLATRMGGDLKGASIQVGKALNDPIQGMTALRRVGVSFSASQREVIKHMQETGDLAGAQKIILNELATEFGGSALASFNADPLARFNKLMGSLKVSVGEATIEFLHSLAPALESIAQGFKDVGGVIKDVVHWFKEHENVSETLGVFLKAIVGTLLVYNAQQKLAVMWTALTTTSFVAQAFSAGALTAGLGGASIAGMTFAGVMGVVNAIISANPISLIVLGIAGLITLIYQVTDKFHDWGASITLIMGPIGLVIAMIMSLKSHWESIKKAFETDGIIGGLKRIGIVLLDAILYPLQQAMEWVAKITGADWAKGASEGIKKIRDKLDLINPEESEKKKAIDGHKKAVVKTINGAEVKTGKTAKAEKVSGSKVVTINVSIGNLINDFQIKTTNIQESATAIREKVVQALTSAINDSQIIAGQ